MVVGHSYGTNRASSFCLAHPDRVAALLLMCGPFVGDWRSGDQAERDRRMSPAEQMRLRLLEHMPDRTVEQETELLTLAWFTDHADRERGWQWAALGARQRGPVNWCVIAGEVCLPCSQPSSDVGRAVGDEAGDS